MSLYTDLLAETRRLPVIDIHSHVRHQAPQAQSPAEVLLYHVLAAEMAGAGMSSAAQERLRKACDEEDLQEWLRYWGCSRATSLGRAAWRTAQDVWGAGEEPTLARLRTLWDRVTGSTARDPGWTTQVWDRCGVRAIAASSATPPTAMAEPRMRWQLECGFWGPGPARLAMEATPGVGAEGFADAYAAWLAGLVTAGARSMALSPDAAGVGACDEATLARALSGVTKGAPLAPDETLALNTAQGRGILRCSHETGVPIFLAVGVDASGGISRLANVDHTAFVSWLMAECAALPGARVMLADSNWSTHQTVCMAARQCRGIYATGHWWQSLFEAPTLAQMHERLDTVPMNKVIAFFSDAWCAEWVYPRLCLCQEQMARALASRVEDERLDSQTALTVARCWLHDNAAEVMGERE